MFSKVLMGPSPSALPTMGPYNTWTSPPTKTWSVYYTTYNVVLLLANVTPMNAMPRKFVPKFPLWMTPFTNANKAFKFPAVKFPNANITTLMSLQFTNGGYRSFAVVYNIVTT